MALVVGLHFTHKKRRKLSFVFGKPPTEIEKEECTEVIPNIFEDNVSSKVEYLYIDVEDFATAEDMLPVYAHVQVFVWKPTDLLVNDYGDALVKRMIAWMALMEARGMVIVDSIDQLSVLTDRFAILKLLEAAKITHNGKPVTGPPSLCVARPSLAAPHKVSWHSTELENVDDLVSPVIIKSRTACSSTEAHKMTLEYAKDWNERLQTGEWVVQTFVAHDALQYKVYVLGGDVFVIPKASVPNPDLSMSEPWHFHSHTAFESKNVPDEASPQRAQEIKEIALALQLHLNLKIFGIDVIIHHTTGRYFIVDINYFPSFQRVPQLRERFEQFFLDEVGKRK